MNTELMTEEERKEYEDFLALKRQKKAEEDAKKMREEYSAMVDEQIEISIAQLKTLSEQISDTKSKVMDNFKAVIDLKKEIIPTKNYDEQRSHTFTNSEGTKRITLGVYTLDAYSDTAEDGIQKVKDYISSLAKDENSEMLVNAVLKLLSKNKQGMLKASRIIQLRKMAEESGSQEFMEGVRIIEESYRPTPSKTFIRADVKSDNGSWQPISLGVTEG